MNEMLGNHYFLTKRFKEAIPLYQTAIFENPNQIQIKKKLVICLLKENKIKEAINVFSNMLNSDLEQILISQNEDDDCICKQMIFEMENNTTNLNEKDRSIVLGILWLFCNSLTSLKYFEKLDNKCPKDQIYKDILNRIKLSITQN